MSNEQNLTQKEYPFKGLCFNGFAGLGLALVLLASAVAFFASADNDTSSIIIGGVCVALFSFMLPGFAMLEPNESLVTTFFGRYTGTIRRTGYFWFVPLYSKRKVSLRIRNLDIDPIKVNDRMGNPVLIGMVLVWKVQDTYRAVFDIDSIGGNHTAAYNNFVAIQADAALREMAGQYAYDSMDSDSVRADAAITLRSGGDAINNMLESKINDRLAMAGITVVEARINYLAYAPEIAAVMLRRQQAAAIISAREKIVDGAVSMVDMALRRLENDNVVKLDDARKGAIVGNLLMVLCSDDSARPVIPAER